MKLENPATPPALEPGEYEYVGDGLGVPGLPHQLSTADAEALGVLDLLAAAVHNGSYVARAKSLTD